MRWKRYKETKYALHPLVSVWMSLYYNLPRIRKWSPVDPPNIERVFSFLSIQSYRKEDYQSANKVKRICSLLKNLNLEQSRLALDYSFKKALMTQDLKLEEEKIICLLDFPRFAGATWAHNDLLLYMPKKQTAAVMKLADKRFLPLHEKLTTITMGLDPFIGTSFTINAATYNPIFNRIRCTSQMTIDNASFCQIKSFEALVDCCNTNLRSPTEIASIIIGNSSLDLSKCVIARYENYYCLLEIFQCQTKLVSVNRNKDWSFDFVFDFEGVHCRGTMLRDSLFDPEIEPERIPINSNVELLGFITYGRTSLQAFGKRILVIAIRASKVQPLPEKLVEESDDVIIPTINDVENELTQIELREERKRFLTQKRFKEYREDPCEIKLGKITDGLLVGDFARILSAHNATIQDLFDWKNGGQPLLLLWSRGGRRSSTAIEEFRSALRFIMGTRHEVNLPIELLGEAKDIG